MQTKLQTTAPDQPWDETSPEGQRSKAWRKMEGIDLRPDSADDTIIYAHQTALGDKGLILTQKDLVERGRTLYPDKRYKIHPITFCLDTDHITPEWIQEQMALYGIKPKDLIKQLSLTKGTISSIVQGSRPIAPHTKALVFYYFLSLKLGRVAYMDITASELQEALEVVRERRATQA